MKRSNTRRGFTLIELLVVVLIIGILAAIAVPQYQKAVRKARLAEVHATLKTLMKGVDLYVLEHGIPKTNSVRFLGNNPTGNLDMKIAGKHPANQSDSSESTKLGVWTAGCWTEREPNCVIGLSTYTDEDGNYPNKWLNLIIFGWRRGIDGVWYLDELSRYDNGQRVSATGADAREICQWWANLYGEERMRESVKTNCAAN